MDKLADRSICWICCLSLLCCWGVRYMLSLAKSPEVGFFLFSFFTLGTKPRLLFKDSRMKSREFDPVELGELIGMLSSPCPHTCTLLLLRSLPVDTFSRLANALGVGTQGPPPPPPGRMGGRPVCIRKCDSDLEGSTGSVTFILACRIGSESGLKAADVNEVKVPRILWRTDFGTPRCPFFSNGLLLFSFTCLPAFLVSPFVAAPCPPVSAWASNVTSLLPSTCAPTSSALDSA
mmetsp:Transcript_63240/g.102280  ORF Transcript_63240/g.102280 Transcript_63240/m.102280 type:complete len:234 (+) Transcript_63240:87-788(+)